MAQTNASMDRRTSRKILLLGFIGYSVVVPRYQFWPGAIWVLLLLAKASMISVPVSSPRRENTAADSRSVANPLESRDFVPLHFSSAPGYRDSICQQYLCSEEDEPPRGDSLPVLFRSYRRRPDEPHP